LDVWQKAVEFASDIYEATRDFPSDERFGLTSQMRRASVSISSNIAEGAGRSSDTEFGRFIEIAYGSLMEVVSQATIALRRSLLAEVRFRQVYERAEELARMLSGLRSSLQNSRDKRPSPSSGSGL
jgi:four helix bundle protein